MLLLPQQGKLGTLQFHLARANGHWNELASGARALAIFQGPHGYISPKWYKNPLSVPTWNYVAVHATGTPRMLSDAQLTEHLHALVAAYEPGEGGWSTDALPPDFFDKLQRAVVGFEMEIADIYGKWKLGQNRSREDREGAIEGLRASNSPEALTLADWMAATLKDDGAPAILGPDVKKAHLRG
jgi:transcriptional regulator